MLRPPPEIHRFLLTSSAWFVGEYEGNGFLITPAFPDFSSANPQVHHVEGPYRKSFMSLSLQIAPPERDGSKMLVMPDYNYVARDACHVMTVFYGKLIENNGYTERYGNFAVPNIDFYPQHGYQAPPFNSDPRAATGISMNLSACGPLLERMLPAELNDDHIALFRACSFYHASLRLYMSDPVLANTLLLSSLESLIPLFAFKEEEIYDAKLIQMLAQINEHVPNADDLIGNLKSRLFQVRRKCSLIAERSLDEPFFAAREAVEEFYTIKPHEVEARVKAAYDLRSLFIHTGKSHGLWASAFQSQNSEIIVGEPAIEDAELKKLVIKAPTLVGIERIVHYCLYRQIRRLFLE